MNEIHSYLEDLCFEINMRINEDLENFVVKSLHEGNYDVDFDINIKKIAEAINKQTEKKPDGNKCAVCGESVVNTDENYPYYFNYCPNCGQRIDWSKVE